MPLTKLQFRPGVATDITSYSNEGSWVDCDKIRFRFGYPEKIGGWKSISSETYEGTARTLINFITTDSSDLMGIGTHLKYYIEEGGSYNDVTPLRVTTSAVDVTFSASNGSSTITVTDATHGALENDFVTFSGAASLGGNVTADVLNQEYQITNIVNVNSYQITAKNTSGATVTANSSDSSNGGSSVVGKYQINTGLNNAVDGTGWGGGLWGGEVSGAALTTLNEGGTLSASDTTITLTSGTDFPSSGTLLIDSELIVYSGKSTNDITGATRGSLGTTAATHSDGATVVNATDFFGWGSSAPTGTTLDLRLWSHDTLTDDLLLCARDSSIFRWEKVNGLNTRAIKLVDTTGGTPRSVPTIAKQVMVFPFPRHVIAFGCDDENSSSSATEGDGVQNPLRIRFSDSEDQLKWFAVTSGGSINTAGGFSLGVGSEIVQAVKARREVVIFTDTAIYSMTFIGGQSIFSANLVASNISIISPNAAVAVDDTVYWMGKNYFYVYSGTTHKLACTVELKVFGDINIGQFNQVVAGANADHGEIWWFYTSASASQNDRYVIYNYQTQIWYFGSLSRTAWIDKTSRANPHAAGASKLFKHEDGVDDDTTAMTPSITSAVMDIGDGENFSFIRRIVPDINFTGSEQTGVTATFTLEARTFPGTTFGASDSGTVTRTATSPVDQFTDQLHIRLRGRAYTLKVSSDQLGVQWQLGSPRFDVRSDGRR